MRWAFLAPPNTVSRLSRSDVTSRDGETPSGRNSAAMATSLAPRIYGLDAISAAALPAGGEEAAQFARRLFGRVADKDLAAAAADQRAGAATSLLAFARRR